MNVSKQLRAWRGVKGKGNATRGNFSQEEAAERLGIPVGTYRDWEQGRSAPRGIALSALLERIK